MFKNALAGLAAISLAVAPVAAAAQQNTRPVDAAISLGGTGWSPLFPDDDPLLGYAGLPWEAFLIGLGIFGGVLVALVGDVEEDDGRGPGNNASPGTGG